MLPTPTPPPPISDKRRIAEITAVLATALGKFIFMDHLNWKLPFIVCAILMWIIYVIQRYKANKEILKYWGFEIDNFNYALKLVLPFGLIVVLACIGIGYYNNTLNITWHILPLLILYPVWGTIQQFLLIALVAGNLHDIKSKKLPVYAIILLSAVLFGLIHYPFYWLMGGTFILALYYGYIYFKAKNLYVLGLFHGWLGAVCFYTIVNRDPFMETFGFLF